MAPTGPSWRLLILMIVSLGAVSFSLEAADPVQERRNWFFQAQATVASESDFGPAIAFIHERPDQPTRLYSVGIGRQVADSVFGWPATVLAWGGVQRFDERGFQNDAAGVTLYVKAYRDFQLGRWKLPLRIGLGEGISYASRIPIVEVVDFEPERSAKLTNYLEWSVQTSLNHLLGRPNGRFAAGIRDIRLGYSIFHRSTVFGLYGDKGGGVNYMGIGVELEFE